MRRKIVVVSNSYSAVLNFRSEFLNTLKHTYDVSVIAPPDHKDVKDYLPWNLDRKSVGILNNLRALLQLKYYLDLLKPELVISYTLKPIVFVNFLLILRQRRYQSISVLTGLGTAYLGGSILKRRLIWPSLGVLLASCRHIVVLNQSDRCRLVKLSGIRDSLIEVIDGEGYAFTDRLSIESSFNYDFVYSGRLIKSKGILDFLEAIRLLGEENYTPRVLILGDSETSFDGVDIKRVISDKMLSCVAFKGFSNDVKRELQSANCLVHPTHGEGVSFSVLDAIDVGLLIVTTQSPGMVDMTKNGLLFELSAVGDPSSLSAAMKRIMLLSANSRHRIVRSNRDIASRIYSREKVIPLYLNLVRKVLGEV